ncbi:hypothetical protein SSBG_05942 [Streptomyces sp. SPB074]|nr:hypothetical protein SSBG_05942 [Streptomyces sp. SPB074]
MVRRPRSSGPGTYARRSKPARPTMGAFLELGTHAMAEGDGNLADV